MSFRIEMRRNLFTQRAWNIWKSLPHMDMGTQLLRTSKAEINTESDGMGVRQEISHEETN